MRTRPRLAPVRNLPSPASASGAVAVAVGESGRLRPMHTLRSDPAPIARSAFAGFCFPSDVIVLAVRWYLRFGLPGQPRFAGLGEPLDHPPGGRDQGHRPQQRLAPGQQPQVAEAVPAVGPASRSGHAAPWPARAAAPDHGCGGTSRSTAAVSPTRSASSASSRTPDVADQPLGCNDDVGPRLDRLHPHPAGLADRSSTSRILPAPEGLLVIGSATPPRFMKSRG
jgi:hypothetical protein